MAHKDYSFAAAWHPDGNLLATGERAGGGGRGRGGKGGGKGRGEGEEERLLGWRSGCISDFMVKNSVGLFSWPSLTSLCVSSRHQSCP